MANEAAILNHQLQGIMLHSDLADMYHFLRMWRFCKLHMKQMFCEQETNIKTRFMFIDKAGKIIDPGPIARVKLPDVPADNFLTAAEKAEMHIKLLREWHTWETGTVALYETQIVAEPDCKFWKRLRDNAEREAECIEKLLE